MSFRIDRVARASQIALRVHGRLAGPDAEVILREQIASARAERGAVVLEMGNVTLVDPRCLAVIAAGLGTWLSVEGGGAYVAALLRGCGSK